MSVALSINITDRVTPLLDRARAVHREEGYLDVIGVAATGVIQDHLGRLDTERANSLGGARSHFYANAARGTNFQRESDGVLVQINHTGFRQRLEGGTIRPTNPDGWLTIPARTESYGRRAREFTNLRFILFKSGAAALVERDATQVQRGGKRGARTVQKGREEGGLVLFWLVKSVTQDPDPSVMPENKAIGDACAQAANNYLTRRLAS